VGSYVLSCLDRIVLYLLVVPTQPDLGINDTQFRTLQRLPFGLWPRRLRRRQESSAR